jgi:methylated-DNA-[protein]-cysteine S-methyltransferase
MLATNTLDRKGHTDFMTLNWTVVPAPFGALTIGVTAEGLALVAFGDDPGVAARAAERLGESDLAGVQSSSQGLEAVRRPREPCEDDATAEAARQVREYLAGERRAFDVPLDWRLTAGSQRRVLEALYATVGYGATVTYGELAGRAGLGGGHTAARGVGAIMGSNPLPVVVPCHRVLAADGLGGFGGGRATKEWLLALEGVLTPALDFE